jgi:N utilization substance protein B
LDSSSASSASSAVEYVLKKDKRHRAREAALQILYQWEIGRTDVPRAVDTFFSLQWPDETPPADELRTFAAELAHDTVRRLADIDALIADTSERWRPERMPVVDRLILRMATCELLRGPDIPAAVVINEALELARTFSTEESVKFVNGMLDGIRKKIEHTRGSATAEGAEDAEEKS